MDQASITAKLDEISVRYGNATVAFLRKPKSAPQDLPAAEAFGSGFLVNYRSSIFLITACHVLDDCLKTTAVLRFADGCALALEHLLFVVDREADLAATLIGPLLENLGIDMSQTVPICSSQEGLLAPTTVGLFIGYPNSMNRIDHRSSNIQFNALSISADLLAHKKNSSDVSHPLYFGFQRKKMIPGLNRSPSARVAPEPFGISGGPVLSVFVKSPERLDAYLIGVGVEWKKQKSVLVAADAKDIWPLLDDLLEPS